MRPAGIPGGADRTNGITSVTITMMIAAALRRTMVATARVRTAATANSAAMPTMMRSSVGHGSGNRSTPSLCATRVPMSTAPAAAARPTANATAPITIAFAASTRTRFGLAASVLRIRPRRYSAVMNIAAITAIAMSPMKMPSR